MSSAGRELRFQWPVNSSGCTREQIKTQLIFAILPTECVFHYRLNPKKRSSDSDNNLRCIDFYDQFAKLMTLHIIDQCDQLADNGWNGHPGQRTRNG